uniref:Putative secreted peptide n=1 Tax=Anopheles braziliensis TaxID=58242 RepID=A0A2M3ZUT8_9DIPT
MTIRGRAGREEARGTAGWLSVLMLLAVIFAPSFATMVTTNGASSSTIDSQSHIFNLFVYTCFIISIVHTAVARIENVLVRR